MSETIARDDVSGPLGDFEVSTIRTDAGGAQVSGAFGMPFFSSADYIDETPWPFETMVFRAGTRVGVYHEPHRTEKQAREGHRYALSICRAGTLRLGTGVQGPNGTPTITASEWSDRMATTVRKSKRSKRGSTSVQASKA